MSLLARLNSENLAILRSIGQLAQAQDMHAYLVGGPVRDLMLQKPNIDLDIAVEGSGIRLAQEFMRLYQGASLEAYPAFKTAHVVMANGCEVDFATARQETYKHGGAFPSVKPIGIIKDLKRRDFTMNAMALALNPNAWGACLDPYGGAADLAGGYLRVLHDKSFQDDPTRILRAARFQARFHFQLEPQTLELLKTAVDNKVLDTITPQRYFKDLQKILKEPNAEEALECLKSWNAYKGD